MLDTTKNKRQVMHRVLPKYFHVKDLLWVFDSTLNLSKYKTKLIMLFIPHCHHLSPFFPSPTKSLLLSIFPIFVTGKIHPLCHSNWKTQSFSARSPSSPCFSSQPSSTFSSAPDDISFSLPPYHLSPWLTELGFSPTLPLATFFLLLFMYTVVWMLSLKYKSYITFLLKILQLLLIAKQGIKFLTL